MQFKLIIYSFYLNKNINRIAIRCCSF